MQYVLLLSNVLLLLSGQLLWKVGVANLHKWDGNTFMYLITSPFIIGGGIIYVAATGLWLYILSKMPFSVAYPFQSISYVLGLVAAYFIFKEQIDLRQWIGMGVIVLGVYLIAK